MDILPTLIWCTFLALGLLDTAKTATFRLYNGSLDNFIETPLNQLSKFYSRLDKDKNITIYASGYRHRVNDSSVCTVISAFIKRNTTNAILLNWEDEAKGELPLKISTTGIAVAAARLIASVAGKSLVDLIKNGFSPNKIRLYGFDLGAHLVGWIGGDVQKQNYNVSRIYGLDPARTGFEWLIASQGLNPSQAQLVIGLHTNPGGYGAKYSVGTIDFWANCGHDGRQPGCFKDTNIPSIKTSTCSHNRSFMILAEALMNSTAFPATRSTSCTNWKYKIYWNSTTNNYGDDVDPSARGNFYFSTNHVSPYSKGQNSARASYLVY